MSIQQHYGTRFDPTQPAVWPVFPHADVPALLQDPRTGAVHRNPQKLTQRWHWLLSEPQPVVLPAGVGGATVQAGLTAQLEEAELGDLEVVKLVSTQTGRYACRIFDTFLDRHLSNAPIPVDLMFGVPELPGVLYETIFLPASSTLALELTNLTAAPNTVRICAAGRRFMGCAPRARIWDRFRARGTHPYWLTFDQASRVNVPAATTVRREMTVPTAGDFEAWLLMVDVTDAAAVQVDGLEVQILEGRTGRSLLGLARAASIPVNLIAAQSRDVIGESGGRVRACSRPYALSFTHLFVRGTQVQVDLVNTNAFPVDVAMAWHGRMIYAVQCEAPQPTVEQVFVPVPVGPVGTSGPCPTVPGWASPPHQAIQPPPVAPAPAAPVWQPAFPGAYGEALYPRR